jgi:hypothetical protein
LLVQQLVLFYVLLTTIVSIVLFLLFAIFIIVIQVHRFNLSILLTIGLDFLANFSGLISRNIWRISRSTTIFSTSSSFICGIISLLEKLLS